MARTPKAQAPKPEPAPDEAEPPPTQDEVEGKKEPRVYKGVEKAVTGLVAGEFIQSLPGTRTKVKSGGSLPLFMQVMSATRYRAGTTWLQYQNPRANFTIGAVEVPDDFLVNSMTGRMRDALAAECEAHKLSNLGVLRWPGGYLGTDPEVFVTDKAGDIIPAFKFLPPKKKPHIIDRNYVYGGELYWDGFQAEFTTEATNCLQEQTLRIARGLNELHNLATKFDKSATLSIDSVLPVPPELLAASADEHVEFGCAPSTNVYGLTGNTAAGRETTVRFAGGHLHLGIAQNTPKASYPAAIKALDAILGVGCVSMFDGYDNATRRQYYGLPGEYRTPPHGIEYRTLSNAWLIHPLITNVVFEVARRAVAFGVNGFQKHWDAPESEVIDVIRGNDVVGARKILKRNEKLFRSLMGTHVFSHNMQCLVDLFANGMGQYLTHPRDIARNWGLRGNTQADFNFQRKDWGWCSQYLPDKV